MGFVPSEKLKRQPLTKGNSLDHLEYVEVTPIIGRENPMAKIKDMLTSSKPEEQLRDLAITICERGVVFFRGPQDDLSIDEQKYVTDMLGKLTGRPAENGLHVHPLFNDPNNVPMADGTTDENIYVINSDAQKKLYATMKGRPAPGSDEPRDLGREWHSDSLFETCPSDFSFLRMQATPAAGGDTLWASGYELYDRLSPPLRRLLESLTAECAQPVFRAACEAGGYPVASPRGSPRNVGLDGFAPHHPVVRTHPVTGWKSVFAGVGLHVSRIDGVWAAEDQMIREYLLRLLTRSHDCVARMHWTPGACAIWSNVCTLHAATVSLATFFPPLFAPFSISWMMK